MADYRRWYMPGGTYFFTVVTYRRRRIFRDPRAAERLGAVLREVRRDAPFETVAIALLWDHLHCIWTLPEGDSDYSMRWNAIKKVFTAGWLACGGVELAQPASRVAKGERGVWQRRFWEHVIRDEDDLERCCDYIHFNPAKHGYVARPADWPWSSFPRFVAAGHYPPDWGTTEPPFLSGLDFEWE